MIQTRLCHHFRGICKHPSREPVTWLDLPENVRFRVYSYSDIPKTFKCPVFPYQPEPTSETPLYLNVLNGTPLFCVSHGEKPSPLAPYHAFRLVSRMVHADIPRFMCTHYEVVLPRVLISPELLRSLIGPPSNLLSYCRKLSITLNHAEHEPKCACCACVYDVSDIRSVRKLSFRSDSDKFLAFLPTWRRLVDALTLSNGLAKLDLSILCDVEDSRAAGLILQPLNDLRISKFKLRLSNGRDPHLESLARETVLCATSHHRSPRGPFRIMDLPVELRQHILGFTDLKAPFNEISWHPDYGFHRRNPRARDTSACRGDFCCRSGTVYPPCPCWQSPGALFLVCHAMLADARSVFYASNRFVIMPRSYKGPQPDSTHSHRLEASIFLTKIVPCEYLTHLREMEILLPSTGYRVLGIDPQVLRDWEQAIRSVAMHLRRLKLTLCMVVQGDYGDVPLSFRATESSYEALFKVHKQIVEPLRQLDCFDSFFVYAGGTLSDPDRIPAYVQVWTDPFLKDHENHLEAIVMGTAYDSAAKGKVERKPSQWVSMCWSICG